MHFSHRKTWQSIQGMFYKSKPSFGFPNFDASKAWQMGHNSPGSFYLGRNCSWTEVMGSNPIQARFSFCFPGINFTTAQVVCITAMINHKFISFSPVQIYHLSCIFLYKEQPSKNTSEQCFSGKTKPTYQLKIQLFFSTSKMAKKSRRHDTSPRQEPLQYTYMCMHVCD